jgi:anti-sigma factor RsiW
MGTNLIESTEEVVGAVCTKPGFAELVNKYLDDPLSAPEAKEVEDHLLDCRACREFVDMMLSIRGEAARSARANDKGRKDGRPARLATYRKERLQPQ